MIFLNDEISIQPHKTDISEKWEALSYLRRWDVSYDRPVSWAFTLQLIQSPPLH